MERVGDVLRGLEDEAGLGRRLGEARALEAWPEIVGRQLESRTLPLRVAGGRLLVVASGSALRQELSFHKKKILWKFNEIAGARVANEVVFLEGDLEPAAEVVEAEGTPGSWKRTAESRGAGVEPADEEGAESTPSDPGLAYRQLDAAAYRRELAGIRREDHEQP